MTVYAITDTKKGRTGIAPTYLQTTQNLYSYLVFLLCRQHPLFQIFYHPFHPTTTTQY